MKKVDSLLQQFSTIVVKDQEEKNAIRAAINTFFPNNKTVYEIKQQKNILYIQGSNTLKHAIQLQKTEILSAIQKKLKNKTIKDIR